MAENNKNTRENPKAAPKPYQVDSKKPRSRLVFCNATPSTAQLVVMSGKKIPSTRYNKGLVFSINIFENCTTTAITRINEMVRINSIFSGTSIQVLDRKSTRLNSSHVASPYAVSCLKKK